METSCRASPLLYEAEYTDNNKVNGDDVVKQPRHQKDKNAGEQRDDRLQGNDVDGHGRTSSYWLKEPNRGAGFNPTAYQRIACKPIAPWIKRRLPMDS